MVQVLASFAKNVLVFQMGFVLAFPTILISSLTGLSPDLNPDETMLLMPSETTWIGEFSTVCFQPILFRLFQLNFHMNRNIIDLASISFISQPLGSIFSGLITEPIGRKWAMIAVNIPVGIAWLLMYYAQDFNMILLSFVLLGISVGLMEASILTYIGEIS